jgi:hypothetical protein
MVRQGQRWTSLDPAKGDRVGTDGAVPIGVLAARLGRSVRTLKRWYAKRWLPVLIFGREWFVPESFLTMLFASPQPGRAGVLQEVAAAWFALHAPTGGVS